MSDKKMSTEPIIHGLMIGGAIGLIGSWFGLDAGRAIFLGLLSGFLAGVTKARLDRRK